jgi:hypothetical protein
MIVKNQISVHTALQAPLAFIQKTYWKTCSQMDQRGNKVTSIQESEELEWMYSQINVDSEKFSALSSIKKDFQEKTDVTRFELDSYKNAANEDADEDEEESEDEDDDDNDDDDDDYDDDNDDDDDDDDDDKSEEEE